MPSWWPNGWRGRQDKHMTAIFHGRGATRPSTLLTQIKAHWWYTHSIALSNGGKSPAKKKHARSCSKNSPDFAIIAPVAANSGEFNGDEQQWHLRRVVVILCRTLIASQCRHAYQHIAWCHLNGLAFIALFFETEKVELINDDQFVLNARYRKLLQ